MPADVSPRPRSKAGRRTPRKRRSYHHGDLRRALIEEAVHTIQSEGVPGLTLRQVGERLGVSRTALYRHFADKGALLAAVAREGFRTFREELIAARAAAPGPGEGIGAMGLAYVRFATTHPSHYRVMFGGFVDACDRDPELDAEAQGSFLVLVEAITEHQAAGRIRADDPLQVARYVWAVMHGLSMLLIDGQLHEADPDAEVAYAVQRIRSGIGVQA